jgi:hypothetical protein
MQLAPLAVVLVTAGILLAIGVAILVGWATARLFFHASGGHADDAPTAPMR